MLFPDDAVRVEALQARLSRRSVALLALFAATPAYQATR